MLEKYRTTGEQIKLMKTTLIIANVIILLAIACRVAGGL